MISYNRPELYLFDEIIRIQHFHQNKPLEVKFYKKIKKSHIFKKISSKKWFFFMKIQSFQLYFQKRPIWPLLRCHLQYNEPKGITFKRLGTFTWYIPIKKINPRIPHPWPRDEVRYIQEIRYIHIIYSDKKKIRKNQFGHFWGAVCYIRNQKEWIFVFNHFGIVLIVA